MILCGKEFTTEEINQILDIIAENQHISRTQLSLQVCKRLNWRSAEGNGKLKEMMNRYHYLGSGPLCGNQMKYLIEGN